VGEDTPPVLAVQRDHPDLHFRIVDAVRHDTQRPILWALVSTGGRVTYDDLAEFCTTSDRTVRKHANRLVDDGLLERTNANLVFFEFASDAAEVLIRETLSQWTETTVA
jgi:DeoR/GlpR family transcriptional regulator of sugar metabolism